MKCPECDKRDFMIEELRVQIRDIEERNQKLLKLIEEINKIES